MVLVVYLLPMCAVAVIMYCICAVLRTTVLLVAQKSCRRGQYVFVRTHYAHSRPADHFD